MRRYVGAAVRLLVWFFIGTVGYVYAAAWYTRRQRRAAEQAPILGTAYPQDLHEYAQPKSYNGYNNNGSKK